VSGAAQRPVYIQIYLGFGSRPFGSLRFKPLPAPPSVAVILTTDMAEMGLTIALHMGPLEVAAVFALIDVVLLASLSDRQALFARVVGLRWRLALWSGCDL
jgi:hypothetical protein